MLSFTCKISFALLLFLSVMSFHGTICSGSSRIRCHQSDRSLLQIFREGVNDSYNLLSSWSTQPDCCAWHGVHCDNITGRVTRLDLQCYNDYPDHEYCLKGEINLSLLQLEFLNYLDLSVNRFETIRYPSTHSQRYHNQSLATSSPLYANFSSSLIYLDFSYNYYHLHMDNLHWLSLVPSLKYLNLNRIDLSNQTNWLQSMAMLPSLSVLRLSSCGLGPPSKYVNFTSLVTIDLSYNNFESEVPDWLFKLSSELSYVDLSHNNFQGQIPQSLLNSRNLKTLHFSFNKLNGSIPNWLGELEHLQDLDLYNNFLSGPIPSNLGNLSSLVGLDIGLNRLSGSLPESLGQLSNLESLLVGGNSLTCILSETYFEGLANLKDLDLGDTSITLDLGPNWVPPFQLHSLNLRSLTLGPNFPPWIYTQRSLESLDISCTGISSIDHNMFWNFVGGIKGELSMSYNSISGDISKILLNTQFIYLASNNFKGMLPRISENVSIMDASNNSFTGSVSSLLCHTVNTGVNHLLHLNLSSNLLTGELPDCWSNWERLENIYLGNNRLTGELSPSLESLLNLQAIDLRNNSFYGEIPSSLQNCSSLEFINFERNNFTGSIPTWMPKSIKILQLRSNQFVGNIPSQVCQLSNLIVLDIADNKLSGSIPRCLNNISAMVDYNHFRLLSFFVRLYNISGVSYPYEVILQTKGHQLEYTKSLSFFRTIDLSCNNLSREIPSELFNLIGLNNLNLSQNHLSGEISKNIGGMKKLESLDLSNNQLSGEIPQRISELNFLSALNFSYNDFSGQIPIGTQLATFDAWSYIGNFQLCGAPLTKVCTKEEKPIAEEHDESGTELWFFLGMGVGFAVGFWGICGAIFLNRAFRHAYFRLLDRVADKIYVVAALKFNMFR